MQGARTTRTSLPRIAGSFFSSVSAPAMAQDSESQTRTVTAGGARSVLHHVEMRIEGRDLVDFRLRHLHLGGERGEMRGGEMAVMVLDQMQMLDQQVAPARPVGEQRAYLIERRRVDLAALGRARRPAPAGARRSSAAASEYSWRSPDW